MSTQEEKLRLADDAIAKARQKVEATAVVTDKPILPSWWSTTSAMTISAVVLVFGLAVIALATYLIRTSRDGELVLRVFGTIVIVVLAVFLVVAGYSDTQIAPVIGLLGTIAGYLLGRTAARGNDAAQGKEPDTKGKTPAGT